MVLQNVLIENRSTPDMLRDSIDMVIGKGQTLDTQRIHQGQLVE